MDVDLSTGSLGVGVNRRRITPVTAPALTRHIAFWLPSKAVGSIAEHRQCADDAIFAAYKNIQSIPELKASFNTNSWLDNKDSAIVLFGRCIISDKLDVSTLELSQTHRAVKFMCSFDGLPLTIAFDLHEELFTVSLTIEYVENSPRENNNIGYRIETAFRETYRNATNPNAQIIAASDDIFDFIWRDVINIILKDFAIGFDRRPILEASGVILPLSSMSNPLTYAIEPIAFPRKPSENYEPTTIRSINKLQNADAIKAFMPLITCRASSEIEYTLSYLMGRRALYASSLGSGPDSFEDDQKKPLTYLLLADAHNAWQLGRLIYRIHRAGTSRVAATMRFHHLRRLGACVYDISQTINNALASAASAATTDELKNISVRDRLNDKYIEIDKEILDKLKKPDDEALSYRIDRSRYYVRQFHRASDAMRVERVEGFQPYKEFVEQRQGSAFEYLDLLGKRYERLQDNRDLLQRKIQTLTAQINERRIFNAQWTADFALFVVLGPYYTSHLIIGMFDLEHSGKESSIWLGTLIVGLALLLIRSEERFQVRWPKWRTALITAAAVIAVGAFCVWPHKTPLDRNGVEEHKAQLGQPQQQPPLLQFHSQSSNSSVTSLSGKDSNSSQ